MRPGQVLACATLSTLAAGALRAGPDAERNKELVSRFNEAVNAQDLAALDAVAAASFVRHSQATPDVEVTSLEQFKGYLKANHEIFPDERITLSQLVAEADRVAFWGRYAGTQRGPMGPFPASGKRMEIDIAGVFRIADGRIAELWIVWDNLAALAQLGHFPPPATPAK
jgi:steroid delta-isomerase-like uncharacterized protein